VAIEQQGEIFGNPMKHVVLKRIPRAAPLRRPAFHYEDVISGGLCGGPCGDKKPMLAISAALGHISAITR
jgi:hypothetical protein